MLGVPVRFMGALFDLGLGLGEDLPHLCRDDLRESSLVPSQCAAEIREKLGASVDREPAKRLKALVGSRHCCLYLPWCEEREGFDLLTGGRVDSDKACLARAGPCRKYGRHDGLL